MIKKAIAIENAPRAIGPYSQAIRLDQMVFTAGQIGLDPATGELVEGTVEDQAERALENLKAVLEAAGSGLEYVIKTTIFLRFIKDFGAVNEVYGRYFTEKPARSTVAVTALPLKAKVEIEAIAYLPQTAVLAPTVEPEQKPKKKRKKKKKLVAKKKDKKMKKKV